jgi:hypothetical protein
LTAEAVAAAEERLGVKLPEAYVELLRSLNGGYTNLPEWFQLDGCEIDLREIEGIGPNGIDGDFGSRYMVEEWGYPAGTVWIGGDGHTAVLLDYRESEDPSVIYVDTEEDPVRVVTLAGSFEAFLERLTPLIEIDESDDEG